ncbi:MAG TPA: RNA polymerase-binding protein DksA [Epsilonproteobacteria bacterium]|nr:RNA polymerase-binding protein DksA [Campylobacterota bacterium]
MLSTTEIESFRTQLEERKAQIVKNLNGTSLEMNGMRNLELKDEGDHASVSARTAVDSAIMEQQRKELAEIDLALDKIAQEIYGICEMCEEPIGIARLTVKPYARFCITCREITEKEHN